MNKTTKLMCAALILSGSAFAQPKKTKSAPQRFIGIHLNAIDLNTPQRWKETGTQKTLGGLKEQDLGFSLSYWQSVYKHVDFSGKATVMFHDYSAIDRGNYSAKTNRLGVELEPSVNAYLYEPGSLLNAFITTGIGVGVYGGEFGAYVPAGLGLSAQFKKRTAIMIQSQYRISLANSVLKDNLFYSIGVSQSMAKDEPEVVPPPPPPVVTDKDNDGTPDNSDKCPDVAGSAKYNGCPVPDSDGDGLNDEKDKCPNVPGTSKYQGCPVPDTDGDGINDDNDKCIAIKGLARYQGCPVPDTDNDGVNDEEDKCPSVAGTAENMGCPEIKEEVIEKVNYAAKSIQYALGSAKILPATFKSLDEVVALMKTDNSLLIDIEGHSDNAGTEERNKQLSSERAASVKDYFTSKGISADRITAKGFGSEKPVADNNTKAGRAQNRRTEMKLRNH
jgi:outer membrane protein OmpA-like peptidoglycan-associated protein